MLDLDLNNLENNAEIGVVEIEKTLSTQLDFDELDFSVILKGNIDRIDIFNGQQRIIDYKTGKVTSAELKLNQFDKVITDDKKSKVMQLLLYAYMFLKQPESMNNQFVLTGNISFKNMSEGFISVNISNEPRGKDYEITLDKLNPFMVEIKNLILEILNPDIPFTEKEVKYFKK